MELKVLKKDKGKVVFIVDKTNPVTINTLRRYAMNYVPTLAIETIEVKENSSALFDEMLAHRLGLVPLKTDLKSYNRKEECKCKGKGCAQCQLQLSLKGKGPCTVYSGEITTKDPAVKPVIEKLPIVKLLKDQEIDLSMTAILGEGKEHAKFSPCLFFYFGYPELKAGKDSDIKKAVAESKGVLVQKGNGVEIKDIISWNDAIGEICEKNNIEVDNSDERFICTLESWGQLDCKEILTEAVKIFDERLEEFAKAVKKLK